MTRNTPGESETSIVTSTGTGAAEDEVFSATDRYGVRVYMLRSTLEAKDYHPEIDDFEGHRDAVEHPAVIAPSKDNPGRRIYQGKSWAPSDAKMARLQRRIVTTLNPTNSSARIITAYNVSETTSTRGLGTPVWEDHTPPPEEL